MNGVLLFDDNPRHTVTERVEFAALRFYQRTGQQAAVCHINAADKNGTDHIGTIKLVIDPYCRPNHYHAGVEPAAQCVIKAVA